MGRNIFDNDNTFNDSNQRETVKVKLLPGKYGIRLSDNYGDGGINGLLKQGNTTLLDFKWTNLDWSKYNGFNQVFNFTVV